MTEDKCLFSSSVLKLSPNDSQCQLVIGNIGNWQHFHIGNID